MAEPPDDPPDPTEEPSENQHATQVNVRLSPVHQAALERISAAAHLKPQETLRRLIRIADQFVLGEASPFADKLESVFRPRKVG